MKKLGKKLLIFLMALLLMMQVVAGVTALAETSGGTDPRQWKQYEEPWGPLAYHDGRVPFGTYVGIGDEQSFKRRSCLVVSAAIQVAKAGADPTPNFTPYVFAEKMVKTGNLTKGSFTWDGPRQLYGDNFTFAGTPRIELTNSYPGGKHAQIRDAVLKYGYGEGWYPIILGYMRSDVNNNTHFMAIDGIEGDEILVNDPASKSTTLKGTESYMHPNEWTRLYFAKAPEGRTFKDTLGPINNNRPTEDDIAIAINTWDGVNIPGMVKPYDPAWENDVIPLGYAPEDDFKAGIADWKTDIELYKADERTANIRTAFMIIGLTMILYTLLLLTAGVVSNVVEFDLVRLVTLGRYKFNKTTIISDKTMTLNQIITRSGFMIILAIFVISGVMFDIIMMIYLLAMRALEMLGGAL